MRDKGLFGVLAGGIGPEREISLRSGQAMHEALSSLGYNVALFDLNERSIEKLGQQGFDIAVLALHGPYGEDGCIQGLLEWLGIPYTGSSVLTSALCMNKVRTKQLLSCLNVPVLASDEHERGETIRLPQKWPVFVKPCHLGSSVASGIARDAEELERRLQEAWRYDQFALIEDYVVGRELTVGVLDGTALGVLEIRATGAFYDFDAKYRSVTNQYLCPAPIEPRLCAQLSEWSQTIFKELRASGAIRVDFLLTAENQPFCLEVNTLPGMLPTSLLPRIAHQAGYSYPMLCERIVQGARLWNQRAVD